MRTPYADADHLARLDAFDLMMIEQPFAFDDFVQHAELQRRLTTPICLDESITSVDRARDMVTLGSGRIVNIKPGRVGGFTASLAIHDFCETKGIPVWCGGMLESGVGRACNVALASLRNFTKPGDVSPSARYWERDVVTPAWTMTAEGMVRVHSTGPASAWMWIQHAWTISRFGHGRLRPRGGRLTVRRLRRSSLGRRRTLEKISVDELPSQERSTILTEEVDALCPHANADVLANIRHWIGRGGRHHAVRAGVEMDVGGAPSRSTSTTRPVKASSGGPSD